MVKLKVGIDFDDTLCDATAVALRIFNLLNQTQRKVSEITDYYNLGDLAPILDEYMHPNFYRSQKISKENKQILRELMEICDVYIVTSPFDEMAAHRLMQIARELPFFPMDHIIIGKQKSMVKLDLLLDDAPHNLLPENREEMPSISTVRYIRPWNADITGLPAVSCLRDFYTFVNLIVNGNKKEIFKKPCVMALIGPTGSKKTEVCKKLLEHEAFSRVKTTTTATNKDDSYDVMSEEDFVKCKLNGTFCETTTYGGFHYGSKKKEIKKVLSRGKFAVMPVDICGAMALATHFRTAIIYCEMEKSEEIKSILERESFTISEKTSRLLGLDAERHNKIFADLSINTADIDKAVEQIMERVS